MEDLSILNQFQGFLDTPDIFPKDHQSDFTRFDFPVVTITDDLIADLQDLDHPRNSVLGKRMESFFEIAIKHSSRYDLIASNIQIINNKQTLGELDFVIYDTQNLKPIHIELVYKLYVYDSTFPSEKLRWIGPNRRDSFSEKLGKLKTRQFPLLYKSETSGYLQKLGIMPKNIEQQLCFKAQLFTPETNIPKDQNIVNSDCLRGNWYKRDDFLKMDCEENLFYSPKKKDWSCAPENNKNWVSRKELLENIESLFEKNKAPLIWMKTEKSYQRFFIVWW